MLSPNLVRGTSQSFGELPYVLRCALAAANAVSRSSVGVGDNTDAGPSGPELRGLLDVSGFAKVKRVAAALQFDLNARAILDERKGRNEGKD